MSKLWGGRFKEEQDKLFKRFNDSFVIDKALVEADIIGSIAYAQALEKAGVLSKEEAAKLNSCLENLDQKIKQDPTFLKESVDSGDYEDVHSFVEVQLTKACGTLAKKLHTGRSRNDQVSTDFRIYLRSELDVITNCLQSLSMALVNHAEDNFALTIPGYTHLQKAQPVLWAHYLLSFFEMFERDLHRIAEVRKRTNTLTLGSGALAGNSFGVDRAFLAEKLGFEAISKNSLDATGDRDFAQEFLNAGSLIMIHLSRLAEDLIIYSSSEFAFVELSDKVASGSSLMPQKKNPDALELIRGKTGRVFGNQMALQTSLKALASSYNKDLQEDKELVFDTAQTLKDCLAMMQVVVENLKVKGDNTARASASSYMNATELADYLVSKGLAFREAHHLVGEIVLKASSQGKNLEELSLAEFQEFSKAFDQGVYDRLSLQATLESKSAFGGTAPSRVREALNKARISLRSSFHELDH